MSQTVPYGNACLDINTNSPILNATIDLILSTDLKCFFFCFVS